MQLHFRLGTCGTEVMQLLASKKLPQTVEPGQIVARVQLDWPARVAADPEQVMGQNHERKLSCFDTPQPSRKDTSVTRFRGSVALDMG